MSLVRAWRRELVGASGMALIVPATVCAALAVLALAGDFGRLGSLGEVLGGPRLPLIPHPGAQPASAHRGLALTSAQVAAARGSAAASVAARPTAAGPATATPGHSGAPALHRGGAPGLGPGTGPGRLPGNPHGGSPGPARGPVPAPGSGSPAPTPPGPPSPAPSPTAVDRVVAAGTAVTSQLPSPVGSVATQTLQSVGSTVDRVLPLPAPGAGAGPSPGVQLP